MLTARREEQEREDGLLGEDPSLPTASLDAIRDFYDAHGYVVVQSLIDPELCDRIMQGFDREVRHSPGAILRQKNMRYEANQFTTDGFLNNPIFNVQDLRTRTYRDFKAAVLDALTNDEVVRAVVHLLGTERAKLIQSMFFEAPAGTWAHQDAYYQDSAAGPGQAVGGWFALEDIKKGAGRFYVCPGSHRAKNLPDNGGAFSFAGKHENYKAAMGALIADGSLPVVAPVLRKGDVLFWNSLTVHGSYHASERNASRRSLTAHYLRESDAMLQLRTRVREQRLTRWNGVTVGLLHDQDQLRNRIMRDFAFRLPSAYMAVRGLALKAMMASRSLRQSGAALARSRIGA